MDYLIDNMSKWEIERIEEAKQIEAKKNSTELKPETSKPSNWQQKA